MDNNPTDSDRRKLLIGAAALAVAPLIPGMTASASDTGGNARRAPATVLVGRRKLGSLEVSSVGLGVQNMSRTYQTTIPSRPEMLNIIRSAFDHGVTFYDAAEAYGPHVGGADPRRRRGTLPQ